MNLARGPQCATITKRETTQYYAPPDGNSSIREGVLAKGRGECGQTSIHQQTYRKPTEQRSRLRDITGV